MLPVKDREITKMGEKAEELEVMMYGKYLEDYPVKKPEKESDYDDYPPHK